MKCYKFSFVIFILIYLLSGHIAYAENTRILINIPSRTLDLIENNNIVKTYPVGVGRPNFPTPIGNFKVITKVAHPTWENPYKPAGVSRIKPGKNNPLGTRWIGFHRNKQGEYGMHGTNNPLSVGKYSSHGCVRMKIKDSEFIFNKVEINTPVKVSYYTHKVFIKGNKIVVRKYQNAYKKAVNPEKMIREQLDMFNKSYLIDEKKLSKALKMKTGLAITIGEIIHTSDKPENILSIFD